jgi:hypothetical protein
MSAKFGTLAGTIWLKSSRMKYQFLITALLRTPAMFTRIRNMSVMKRKKEVVSAHILRVRVARLICSLLSSGTTVGDVVCETAVSSDLRRREKMPIVGDSEVFQAFKEKQALQRRIVREASGQPTTENLRQTMSEEYPKHFVDECSGLGSGATQPHTRVLQQRSCIFMEPC